MQRYLDLVGGALYLNLGEAGTREALAYHLANARVFEHELSVATVGVPARLPIFDYSKSKPYRVDFASHVSPFWGILNFEF